MTKADAEKVVVEAARKWAASGLAARAMSNAVAELRSSAPATVEGFVDYFRANELSHIAQARNVRSDLELLEAVTSLESLKE